MLLLDTAKRICREFWRDTDRRRTRERLHVAEIDLSGLQPVTVHARMEDKMQTTVITPHRQKNIVTDKSETRDVQFRIWVHERALKSQDGITSMTLEQLQARNPEIWISLAELHFSSLKLPIPAAHRNEWLAAGKILKSRVTRVIPFDGEQWHDGLGDKEILCKPGTTTWVFNKKRSLYGEQAKDPAKIAPTQSSV